MDSFISIPSAAPNPAPEVTPKISGETIGFLNIPWNDAPEIASEPPMRIAAIILGNLT